MSVALSVARHGTKVVIANRNSPFPPVMICTYQLAATISDSGAAQRFWSIRVSVEGSPLQLLPFSPALPSRPLFGGLPRLDPTNGDRIRVSAESR